jgi:hypothetical protein
VSDDERELVMPYVVCPDPYEDSAFVAGTYCGDLWRRGETGDLVGHERYVPTPLVPQLDLVAMHFGLAMASEPWGEHPDEWTHVAFHRITETPT